MIYITWEKDNFVKDILTALPFLKTLFDISSATIPYISEYTVSIDAYPVNTALVDLTIINSNGNTTYYNPVPINGARFEIKNFTNPNPVITLGTSVLKCSFYDHNNQLIDTIERKFECKYILSVLTWLSWSSEDAYKELLTYIDWMSLVTISADGLNKKFNFLVNQPFYINTDQYRNIIKGLFEGNIYGGSLKGLKSVLDKIKNTFTDSNYELIDLRKKTLWQLPKKDPNSNKYFLKYTDSKLDGYYIQINDNPVVYSDEKPERIHYRLKKLTGTTYEFKSNEEVITLISYLVKLVGYVIKFYNLKQLFTIQFNTPVTITDTFSFNTNLPCIIKGITVNEINYPRLLKKNNNVWEIVENIHWNIIQKRIITVDSVLQNSTLMLEGYTIPIDIVNNTIDSIKSVLTRIYRVYYKEKKEPVFEIYT